MKLKKLEGNDFPEIYQIMEQSFPTDEHRPRAEQLALFENKKYHVYGLLNEEDALIAFIAVWDLSEIAFIEHFAVDPLYRNGGIGSQMLRDVVQILNKTVCLEVELPDTEMACRRIRFYERNGFYFNDYPYIQPPLSKGQGEVPLRIMTTGNAVDFEHFSHIKELLYTQIYHVDA